MTERADHASKNAKAPPGWKTNGPLGLVREDVVRNVAVFGSTGSGKTRSVLLPLLEDILASEAGDPARRAGALIIDAKADMGAHLKVCLQRSGRAEPLQIVGDGGNLSLASLAGFFPNSRAAVEFITRLTQSGAAASGNNEFFWQESSKRFLRQVLALAWARHGQEASFDVIMSALRDLEPRHRASGSKWSLPDEINRLRIQGRLSQADADELLHMSANETAAMARSTTATILANAVAYLEPFLAPEIRQLLVQQGSQYHPCHVIDRGDVVLAALAPTLFGPISKAWRNLIKDEFQGCALRRPRLQHFDGLTCRSINQERLVILVTDEFHTLVRWGVDSGDPSFLDRCREFSVGCLWACQGVSALRAALPSHSAVDHLLNNSGTKIFMKTSCPATIEYACRLGVMAATPPPSPLFVRTNVRRSLQVTPGLLRNLDIGEAVVFFVDGRIERVLFPDRGY